MNLVSCSKNCKHQSDGYCNLKKMQIPPSGGTEGCCYFTSVEENPKNLKSAQNDTPKTT